MVMTMADTEGSVNSTPAVVADAAAPLPYRLVFLLSDDAPLEFRAFYQMVSQDNPSIQQLSPSDDGRIALAESGVEAICGFAHHSCWRVFEQIYACERPDRPLCVLLGDINDDADPPVDTIAPLSARALGRQLKPLLEMRRQVARLAAHSQALEIGIAQRDRQLADYARSHNEMALLKRAIVHNVAHELRTPLLQLKTAVSMLYEDTPESTLIQLAMQATGRLEATVQNITQLAASIEITLGPVVLREVIQAAARALGRTLLLRQHIDRVELQLPERLPAVIGDRQGLVTAIALLLDNALKFSAGRVVVGARQDGEQVEVSVRDYGIGIAPHELEHIFDSFYQIDRSATRRYGGSGVGLAIVKLILDKHEAPIQVVSREGEGSTFTFRLPLANLHPAKRENAD